MARVGEADDEAAFLAGGGELARLIADFDWAATSLGSLGGWPQCLRTATALLLNSPVPMVLLWGADGTMIYNDGYAVFAGGRHPELLGMKVRDAWPEVADFNDHVMTVGLAGGTLSYKDQELTLHRSGQPEQVWMDLYYSPVPDEHAAPAGVLAIVIETTEKIVADRQLHNERTRLKQMHDQSPSFKALFEGPEHRFVMSNQAYGSFVGRPVKIGETLRDVVPEAVEQGYVAMLDTVFASGQSIRANGARFELQRSDGSAPEERFVDFVFQPISGVEGTTTGIYVDGVDVTERVRAQAAISASENQFRTFAQAVPNHVWTAPPDGLLDWFNDRAIAYGGFPLEEMKGSGWGKMVHPEDLPAAAAAWAESLATGRTYEIEFRVRRNDGEFRWHLVRALPIHNEDGRISRWVGTNTDIHDQKLAEVETTRDRDRLWELSQDLMLVCDFAGTITSVNPSAKRLLGFDADDMIGTRLGDYVHPDDRAATAAEVARLATGVTTMAFENRYRSKDGSYKLLDWKAVPAGDRIHAVGRDITQERTLARDRERVWSLSPIVKVVADSNGTVLAVNPSWTKILGWSAEETVGRSLLTFVAEGGKESAASRLRALGDASEGPTESRSILAAKDGSERHFGWTTVPEAGILYVFGRDETAEVEAAAALSATEDALRQAQKMEAVGQLTGGIAHDFNNLLQGITGSLEIIKRRVGEGRLDDLDRFIGGATGAANRAAALTHRLLAFSRRQPLDPRAVQVNPLLGSLEDMLRRTMGEQIDLKLVLGDELWLTRCDPNQLENALLNLVINARDAMPDGGRLTIETCNARLDDKAAARQRDIKPGNYVCICVSDTGVGMDAETIERAFEPFFTTKPIGQGTGLGLSMIYGFARQSEGFAKIYSEPGEGTTFKIYLPRHLGDPEQVEDETTAVPARTSGGEAVLVVEDDAVVGDLIVEVLADLGYRVIRASDGPAGVAALDSEQRIDLLITDIGLPGLNGRQVADAGRAARPHLKVLFMTGYAENAAVASGFLEPGMAMITKPFAIDVLASRIRAILEP